MAFQASYDTGFQMPMPLKAFASEDTPDFADTALGMVVTLLVRSTGKPVRSYYVVLSSTAESTQLDYEDEAWRLAVDDKVVTARSRHGFHFQLS